jgi:pyrimidine-nucleoside phosphorylase
MNTVELIKRKRNGYKLTCDEIEFLVSNFTKGNIPDYQFSAFLMAVYFNGMDEEETSNFTRSMLYSGKIIDLSMIKGAKIDKHSTGGVGDKTSLILAPVAAAAGIFVPMISGRGLGHSGGTLDKLESIPGFNVNLNLTRYKSVLKKCGAVLIGQTANIAPADKRIYALRDVTATVESYPLITGSIMSKKLAEGIDGLVLDIKTGSGAFMKTMREAKELAEVLINTARAFNKKVIGIITDMNQPLGNYIGNWLEVYESVEVLRGKKVDDLLKVSTALSGAMIYLGGKAGSIEEGVEISNEIIESGKAYTKFLEIVKLQGGDTRYIENLSKYPKSKIVDKVKSAKEGYIKSIDNYEVGMAAMELGAGRMTKDDIIDPKAGIIFHRKIGDYVKKGEEIADLYTDKKNTPNLVRRRITESIEYSNEKVRRPVIIKKVLL